MRKYIWFVAGWIGSAITCQLALENLGLAVAFGISTVFVGVFTAERQQLEEEQE